MLAIVAAALLLQDMTAEETLKKIEETIQKAKTVGVKFTQSIERKKRGEDISLKRSGTVLLKEGNRVRVEVDESGGRSPTHTVLVSEGKALHASSNSTVPPRDLKEAPSILKESIAASLVRGNVVTTLMYTAFIRRLSPPDTSTMEPQKRFKVSEVKVGPDEGASKTLLFTVEIADTTVIHSAKVWYDPKTFKVQKRVLTYKIGQDEETLTEAIEELSLNADIPDEKFKRPEK